MFAAEYHTQTKVGLVNTSPKYWNTQYAYQNVK